MASILPARSRVLRDIHERRRLLDGPNAVPRSILEENMRYREEIFVVIAMFVILAVVWIVKVW